MKLHAAILSSLICLTGTVAASAPTAPIFSITISGDVVTVSPGGNATFEGHILISRGADDAGSAVTLSRSPKLTLNGRPTHLKYLIDASTAGRILRITARRSERSTAFEALEAFTR